MVFEKCSERFGAQNHFLFGDVSNQMEKNNSYLIFSDVSSLNVRLNMVCAPCML